MNYFAKIDGKAYKTEEDFENVLADLNVAGVDFEVTYPDGAKWEVIGGVKWVKLNNL